jgi:hypothetical protein
MIESWSHITSIDRVKDIIRSGLRRDTLKRGQASGEGIYLFRNRKFSGESSLQYCAADSIDEWLQEGTEPALIEVLVEPDALLSDEDSVNLLAMHEPGNRFPVEAVREYETKVRELGGKEPVRDKEFAKFKQDLIRRNRIRPMLTDVARSGIETAVYEGDSLPAESVNIRVADEIGEHGCFHEWLKVWDRSTGWIKPEMPDMSKWPEGLNLTFQDKLDDILRTLR